MRVLLWHVHAAWASAFVAGGDEVTVPLLPDRGPDGRGRARTYDWPPTVVERPVDALADEPFDVVVLQRPVELELCERWTGRRPGRDLPAVYVEHNTPRGDVAGMRHPLAGAGIPIVHVTAFNALFWDCAGSPTRVIEHGIPEPEVRYRGGTARAAVVINEAARRGRVTGTDLLDEFRAGGVGIDLFGIGATDLEGGVGDLPHDALLAAMADRRVCVHPVRWTSLGLSLLEAMALGMPVVALATTEVSRAVPASAGVVSTDPRELIAGARRLIDDPDEARARGLIARGVARGRYSLERFLAEWKRQLEAVAA